MKRILAILAAVIAVSACLDVDPILFRTLTMGFVKNDGSLRADDGHIYTFGDRTPEWSAGERVVALLDAQKALNDSVYQAGNLSFTYPLYKKPVVVTSSTEPDTLGTNEIRLTDAWYAGGCLNMSAQIKMIEGAGKEIVNLMIDKRGEASPDTLRLALRHRSDYESYVGDPSTVYAFYASFPLREYMPAKDSVVIKISWLWDGKTAGTQAKVEK